MNNGRSVPDFSFFVAMVACVWLAVVVTGFGACNLMGPREPYEPTAAEKAALQEQLLQQDLSDLSEAADRYTRLLLALQAATAPPRQPPANMPEITLTIQAIERHLDQWTTLVQSSDPSRSPYPHRTQVFRLLDHLDLQIQLASP